MAESRWAGGWPPEFDGAYRTLLAASRDGRIPTGVDLHTSELGAELDIVPRLLRGGLERLADLGLVAPGPGGTVRFQTMAPERWAASSRLFVGYLEVAMRSAVTTLDQVAVERYAGLVDRLRRSARQRDPDLDGAMTDSLRFWIETTPDALVARVALRSLELQRFGLNPSVPWRVWSVEGWCAASLQAARLGDPSAAERAAHVLGRLWPEYLRDAADTLGLPHERLLDPPAESLRTPDWAVWRDDALWEDMLGAIRDGSLERGRVYSFAELLPRFRAPHERLLPGIRRLELMGLVAPAGEDGRSILVTEPTLDDWADTLAMLLGLHELCARDAVTRLDDADRATLDGLLGDTGRFAQRRDYAYTVSVLAITRFFAEHVGNGFLRDATLVTISRLAYILDDPPPFRQWNMQDFLALTREAAELRDPQLAADSAHALRAHFDAHIAEVRAARR